VRSLMILFDDSADSHLQPLKILLWLRYLLLFSFFPPFRLLLLLDYTITSVRLDSQSQRAVLGVGVGKRFVIDKYSTAGFNLFTDYETKSKHRQAIFGIVL
jgi:hypothetical protein